MEKTDKPLTRDALVSMQVIDAKGRLVGKVKDLAFAVGKMGIALTVENEDGEIQNIAWEDVQAAADFIILKPSCTKHISTATATCPNCSSTSSATVNSTALSNMRQTLNMDSAIPTMVLLQRQKIRLNFFQPCVIFLYFQFLFLYLLEMEFRVF